MPYAPRAIDLELDALFDQGPRSRSTGRAAWARPRPPSRARSGTLPGYLFESLSTLRVRVAAQAAEARVAHLRTRNGDHEVDLVVIRDDGRVLAIEVKRATTVDDRDVRHLRWLADQTGDALLDALVLTTGPYAYRRPDGIRVCRSACSGPEPGRARCARAASPAPRTAVAEVVRFGHSGGRSGSHHVAFRSASSAGCRRRKSSRTRTYSPIVVRLRGSCRREVKITP